MKPRRIRDRVYWLGAIDWNRRLFEALTPTPRGTSYNAYLIRGSEKTALLDTVDPAFRNVLMSQLESIDRVDYIVSHHAEQDHSGSIPAVLVKYPQAVVVCSSKAKSMLVDHLHIAPERIVTVANGEELSLGDKTLRFIYTPWVHWPETMISYLVEDRILFTADLFGSHLATSELYASSDHSVLEEARRYYAEIMMPYRKPIVGHLAKIAPLQIDLIAPVHGPMYDRPEQILAAYRDWTSDRVSNLVVLPYITMHGSTQVMAEYLAAALGERSIPVRLFELSSTDIGELASATMDAATLVVGTPTMLTGPHPTVVSALYLLNVLKPKLRYTGIIGSFGWGSKMVEDIADLLRDLKTEMLNPVLCKGLPRADTFTALNVLADTIQENHAELS